MFCFWLFFVPKPNYNLTIQCWIIKWICFSKGIYIYRDIGAKPENAAMCRSKKCGHILEDIKSL